MIRDNYAIQVQQAKDCFLRYDQEQLIRKLHIQADEEYLYVNMLCKLYRVSRTTGDLWYRRGGCWHETNSHAEVMTLMDLVCDSRPDRSLSGKWENMSAFGLMFHQNLLEEKRDSWAERFQANPEALRRACLALEGVALPQGDVSYGIELFEGLRIGLQFWEGDEEFLPRIRYLWDANALMYLKYETMHFAIGLLLRRIGEEMETPSRLIP